MAMHMRATGAILVCFLAATALLAAPPEPLPADAAPPDGMEVVTDEAVGYDVEYAPLWTFRAGAMFLSRGRNSPAAAVIPTAGPGVISNTTDFNYGNAAGVDVGAIRNFANGDGIEMRYFGAFNIESPIVQYGAVGNVRIGSFSNFGATNLTGDANASLHSIEANYLRYYSDRTSWVIGFRAIEYQDDVNYDITFPAFTANYNWNENNHLYGAQLGGNFNLWNLDGPFQLTGSMKAGIYGNVAENDFTLRPSTGGQFDGGGKATRVAFVGDIGVNAAYFVTANLAIRGGYQLLWLDGVATGPGAIATATANSSQAGINSTNNVFFHGATAGVEYVW